MIEPPETPHVHHARHESRHRWFDIAIALAVVLVSAGEPQRALSYSDFDA